MENSLEDIIKGCKKGNRNSFSMLYKTYAKKVYPICLRYSHNTQEAEDNLQDGFITIFKKIKTYKGDGSFEGWLKRIFVNQCLNNIRKSKNIINNEISDEIPDDNEDEIIKIETDTILELIQDLPTQYRLVFNLYILDNYSHKEISKELSISTNTSKSNLSRAKHILKEKLKERMK